VARSRRQRILIVLGAFGAVLVAAVGALILYLTQSDLGRHAPLIERMVADATGYELTIGELHADLDLLGASSFDARDVRLTNPGFEPDSRLVAVDHLVLEIELWPLLDNRIHVRSLEVTGGEVVVRGDPEHGVNWVPHRHKPRPLRSRRVRVPTIVVDRAMLTSVTTSVDLPGLPRPLELVADRLEASTDPTETVLLDLEGGLNGEPLAIAGTVGPVAQIVVAGEIRPDLEIRLADATVTLAGRIHDLAHLGGVDVDVHGEGPDIDKITDVFGLPPLDGGTFSLTADLTAVPEGTRIDVDAALGSLLATIDGSIDALIRPSLIDVTVDAHGPNLATAVALVGVDGAPSEEFEIRGGISWAGFPVTFDAVDVRVGANTLTVDGTLGAPPVFSGSEIEITGSGPDVSTLLSLAGVRFPAVGYRVDGRVRRIDDGVEIERLDAQVGADRLTVAGRLGEWPEMAGTSLVVEASGPSLAAYGALTGIELPAEPFELSATVTSTAGGVRIDDGAARVGSTRVSVRGEVVAANRLEGTRLSLEVEGADLSALQWAHGLEMLPSTSFRARGTCELDGRRVRLEGVTGRVGDVDVEAEGAVALTNRAVDTDLRLVITGPDASWPLEIVGLGGMPARPFEVSGTIRVTAPGLELDGIAARIGDVAARTSGLITLTGGRTGSRLEIDVQGPRLTDVEPLIGVSGLPTVPFSLMGTVHVEPDGYRLEDTVATAGANRLTADGLLATSPDLVGSSFELELGGPDLESLADLVAGWTELPDLPSEPYTVSTSVTIDEAGYDIRELDARIGEAEARISGRLGTLPDAIGTDLTVSARGPDAGLLASATRVAVLEGPFLVTGRVELSAASTRFRSVVVQLGGHLLQLDGVLGPPPRRIGSDLRFAVSGPDTGPIRELTGIDALPELAYRVTGHATGSTEAFGVAGLDATVGRSDVRGTATVTFDSKPRLTVNLDSKEIDLSELLAGRFAQTDPTSDVAPGAPEPSPPDRVFSDEPFEFERLDRLDALISWRVSTLRLLSTAVTDIDLTMSLDNGRLAVGPVEAVGERGGRLEGNLLLEPAADGHRIALQLALRGAEVDLTTRGPGSGREPTTTDLVIDLSSHGRTPHEAASRANGDVIVSLAGGEVDSTIVDLIGADILVSILDALNPFSGAGPETVGLDCAAFVVDVTDGLVLAEPMAVKTDNVTVLGHGAVNLGTEKLDFEWVTKPRKGFGVSASTITNPYVKLGGTLARPALEVKPAQAVVSTGLAVATAGLSFLGKGLYDRVTSEGKVCEKGLEEAQRRLRGEAPHRDSRLFR
jgi:uncharacterized protein involved in outer membrane biogenesis